ncbi:MAG TPA: hypothetical protein PLZ86_05055, partial [bacterium]|nr:hypothetical protein [bacterium]
MLGAKAFALRIAKLKKRVPEVRFCLRLSEVKSRFGPPRRVSRQARRMFFLKNGGFVLHSKKTRFETLLHSRKRLADGVISMRKA